MASRYWVGGTATWDGTTTANWSATSGGASGASVPTSADDVFLDANSGTGTITTSSSTQSPCRNIDCTGYTGTLVVPGIWAIYGSLTYSSGMTLSGAGTIGMNATSTNGGSGWVVTSNGKAFTGNISFNGIGGKWVLADSFALTSGQLAINGGELDTQGFSVTTGQLISSATNVKTFTPRSSSISLIQGFTTVWNISGSNMTVTANTATVTNTLISSSWSDTQGVNWNGLSVNFSGGNTSIFTGVAGTTLGNLTRSTTGSTDVTTFAGPFTITGTLTLSGSNNTSNRHLAQSSVLGTARTITAAAVSLTNVDFIDIAGAGAATPFTGTSLGDALGNSGITFPASVTRYAVNSGNWSNTTMWSATSGGASGASVPLPQDDAVFDTNSAAGTYTVNMLRACRNLDCTNFTRTLAASGTPISYGNFTLGAGMTITGFWAWGGRGSHTITSAGKQQSSRVIATPSGTYTLQDAMTMSVSAQIQHQSGIFITNNFNVSCDLYSSTGTGTRTCTLGTSTVTVLNGTSPWSATSITMSAASSTIVIGNAGASTRTFIGAGQTYGTLTYTVANSSGTLVITGANTFNTINIGVGRTLTLPSSTTTTVTNMNMAGNGVNILRDAGFESGTNNILTATGGDTGAIITATPTPLAGTYAYRVTKGAASADYYNQGYLNYTFPGATQFTVSVWIYSSVAIANAFLATDASYTGSTIAAGGFDANSGPAVAVSANTWTQLTLTITPSVGDLTGTLIVRSALPMASGNTIVHDSWQIETGATATTNTGGTRATLNSSTSGVAATLSKSSGYIAGDYLLVQNIAFTGGGTFYAGSRSLDFGGNTGVSFTNAPQRYWVGGTGTWDASTTTNWAVISGGTGGITAPSTTDAVFFDANSGAGTITTATSYSANINHLNFTGFTGTFTIAASGGVNVFGDATFSAGMTLSTTGSVVLAGTGARTLTTAGKTLPQLSFGNGGSGTYTQQDALTVATNLFLTSGTWDTNGFGVTANIILSQNTNTRTMTLRSSSISVSTAGSVFTTSGSGLTVTSNTAVVTVTGSSRSVFLTAGQDYQGLSFVFNGSGAMTLGQNGTGTSTVGSITLIGSAAKTDTFSIVPTLVCTGTFTVTGNSLVNRALVSSGIAGTTRTITAAAVSLSNVDFMDITGAGAATWSGTSLGDALGNSNITFATPTTRYGVVASNWSNAATWSTTSGGVGGASVPLPQDDVILDANSGAGTYTADMPRAGRNITFTGFTRTLNNSVTPAVFGSLTLSSGMTWSATQSFDFQGRGSHSITTAGKVFASVMQVTAPGGTYIFQDAWTQTGGGSAAFRLYAGTVNTNGFAVTVPTVAASLVSTTRSLVLGASTITLTDITAASTIWNASLTTGLTISAATATLVVSGISTSARTFAGGGSAYGTLTYTVANSPGALVVTGANTFGTLNIGSGRTLTLPSSTTTTVTNMNVAGVQAAADTFTRADTTMAAGLGTATTGQVWQGSANVAQILSNQASVNGNAALISPIYLDASTADIDITATIVSGSANNFGLTARVTNSTNFYLFNRGGIAKCVAGSFTTLATYAAGTWADGDVIRFVLSGSSLSAYRNGVLIASVIDTTYTSQTQHGLYSGNNTTVVYSNLKMIAPVLINASTSTTAATLSKTSGYIAGDYLNVKDITFSGGGTFYAGSRSTNVSNNTGVTFTDAPQRYWVGGSATWDGTAGAKWAVISGGTGGLAIPAATDNVFLDASSGSGTVTIPGAPTAVCRSLNCTGFTGTLTNNGNLNIGDASGGAMTFSSAMTIGSTAGTINLISTNNNGGSGWPITTAGKTIGAITFNGTGGKWVLADALSSTATFGLTAGIAVTAGFTLNVQSVTINNNAGSAKTLDITNSVVNMVGGWAIVGGTNTTLIATGSTINSTGGDGSIRSDGGPWTYNDINITVNNANNRQIGTVGAAFTCNNLTITGTAANRANVMTMQGTPTITGTLTIAGNSIVNRMLIWTNTVGTTRTVTAANVALSNVDFMDIAAAGASAPWSGTSLGDGLGNSNITFPASVTRYAVVAGNWSSTATWSTSSGGAGGASVPLPQDDVYMDANSGAGTYTIDMPRPCRNLDCTGFTRTLSHASWDTIVFGSITLSATTILNSNRQMSLGGRGSHTLTSAGHIIGAGGSTTGTWTSTSMVNSPGATYTMLDALGTGTSSVVSLGTLVTNNFAITSAPTGSGSLAITTNGALQAGTSTISLGGTSGSTFTYASTVTSSLSQATFVISSGASASRNFNGGGQTYGTLTYTVNSFSQLVITGTNTFNTINVNSGKTLTLPSSTMTIVNNWNVAGQNFGYLYLLGGTNSSYASVPHSAALGVSDLDVRVNLAMDTWTPTSSSPIISKWPALSGDMSWLLYAITGGQLQFWYSRDGTTASSVQSSVATGFAAGSRNWVRVTRAAATGTVSFYTSSDGSTWNQLGTTQATTAGSLFAGTTTPVMVGADKGGNAAETVAGKFYRAQMRNNVLNDGTGIVLDIDFASKAFGADTFTESSTNAATVTIGASAITGDGRVAVNSSSVGTQAYLLQAGVQTSSNYLTVKDIVVSGTLPAWSLGGTGGNLLTAAESSFEGSVGSWGSLSGSSSTVVTSTEVAALVGTSVGKATSASANLVVGPTANVTATAGTVYVWRFSTRAATVPRTWGGVGSYNGFSGNYGNSTAPTDAVGSWTDVYGMGVAPVGTNNVSIRASVVMVAGEIHYLDAAGIYQAAQGYAGRTSVDKGNNTNWLFVDLINAQNIPLQSTSTLTAGPLVTEPGAATLASTSTLTTQLTYVAMGAATMASTSTLAVQAAVATTAAVQLQATSTLVTTPQVTVQAFASFLSTSTLLASASLGKFVTADLTSTSVLVAQAIITKFLSVSLLSSSIASVGGIVTTFGFVNLRSISISTTMPTFYISMTWTPGSLVSGFKATMDESWKMSLC